MFFLVKANNIFGWKNRHKFALNNIATPKKGKCLLAEGGVSQIKTSNRAKNIHVRDTETVPDIS